MGPKRSKRRERLEVMLSNSEIEAIDSWRDENMLPSRAAAVRELLHRGLVTDEFGDPIANADSAELGDFREDEESEI